ncbi:MAG TPA: hypothetical protein VES88_13655 [Gemmatimonadaceae bacterium]|nr:hypothetical protein [Gemmatimonadaceae bacterium]
MKQLKLVVVPRSNDHAVAPCTPQGRQPANLSFDRDSAFPHFDGQKTTASVAAKQEAIACVVAPPDRRDSHELVAPRKRIADTIPEKRHDLFKRAVVEEIVDIHPRRPATGRAYCTVTSVNRPAPSF